MREGPFYPISVNRRPNDSHVVATRDADRRQAAYFRVQLHGQIELLNEQTEVLKTALATFVRRGDRWQARRIQHDLRGCAVERRSIIDMLSALDKRFPSEATESRPDSSSRRHLSVAPS